MYYRIAAIFSLIFFLIRTPADAQVLFTFGKHTVTKQEFLKAYNKNNTPDKPTPEAFREYLNLYTRYKLKVQAAKDSRLDTIAAQRAELTAFRSQVLESYMNDEASIEVLVEEAFDRSSREIHLAHIFVSASRHLAPGKTENAEKKINDAYALLSKGEPFEKVAMAYSEDPSVSVNKGDLGYITVFVLPYELETVAYTTPAGTYSALYKSVAGFHIFKNLGERKSSGKVRVAQILLTFPPDVTAMQKQEIKKRADSLKNVLVRGGDIRMLAAAFSNDPYSFENGGEIAAFGTGLYEPAFEEVAFSLREGEVSEPILTSFGYHILKLIQRLPVITDKTNRLAREEVKQQVLISDRMELAKKILLNSIMKRTKFKKHPFSQASFKKYTDSLLKGKTITLPDLKPGTPLFSIEKKVITLNDWKTYLQALPELEVQVRLEASTKLFKEYTETVALEYYRNHLEWYKPEFAFQLVEFKDGNLLFEIMQRKIWDVATTDANGLKRFYEANKNKYWWENSADALIFTASNESVAEQLKSKLATNPRDWKSYIDSSEGLIQGDSARFELGQIPVVDRTNFTKGLITAPVKNETDNSRTFAYIIRLYNNREQRSFEDARGFVINDYQNYLEEKWIAELKKKYPVKVNEAVLEGIIQGLEP